MNWEIDDTRLREISAAPRPIQTEGFGGRPFERAGGGGVVYMMQ